MLVLVQGVSDIGMHDLMERNTGLLMIAEGFVSQIVGNQLVDVHLIF